jgi:glycosyltransferase involved in cell wall biosynthesis
MVAASGSDRPPPDPLPAVDVLVRTFNSAVGLRSCLESIRRYIPVHRLIVVDRNSTDDTTAIARQFGAEIHTEESGIGLATTRAIALAETRWILFVDSDVVIANPDFYRQAVAALRRPRVGAVVGCSVGHRLLYGLPLGLTLLPREWARRVAIPAEQQGAETYFLRRALSRDGLRVAYVADSMMHRSVYRGRNWPEWQGANIRLAAGWSARELAYSFLVILLIHLNSHRLRNVAYTPIFYLRFLRGFGSPNRWSFRDRRGQGTR